MKVTVTVSPLESLPAASGAHELAWSYLLDAIFADAYTSGLAELHIDLPHAELEDAVKLRTPPLQRAASRSKHTGVKSPGKGLSGSAVLGGALLRDPALVSTPPRLSDLDFGAPRRLYTLGFGSLAPSQLRRLRAHTAGWQRLTQLNVYCWPARLWGFPIRSAALLGRNDLEDRALFAMRRTFTSYRRRPAFYHLTSWGQP